LTVRPLYQFPIREPHSGFDHQGPSAIRKGFACSELIGISGAHANPLCPGQWNDQSGRPVSASLNEKLELVALRISARTIRPALKVTVIPSTAALRGFKSVDCRASQPEHPFADAIHQMR